jgi:hypothetical protein
MSTTRIILRNDTPSNWTTAIGSGGSKLKKGEVGLVLNTVTSGGSTANYATAYVGVSDTETAIYSCPMIGTGSSTSSPGVNENEIIGTTPVVYEDDAFKPDGTTVRWDATNGKWIADAKVLTLDAYPTVDGTVVYDADAGKFVVGTAVAATEIDGGTYA